LLDLGVSTRLSTPAWCLYCWPPRWHRCEPLVSWGRFRIDSLPIPAPSSRIASRSSQLRRWQRAPRRRNHPRGALTIVLVKSSPVNHNMQC
jgi:hypothetical protein